MSRVRKLFAFATRRRLATAASIGLILAICFILYSGSGRKGTLILECPNDTFAVEVFAENPANVWDTLFERDKRPEMCYWQAPPEGLGKGRCVFFCQAEPGRWKVRLRPGIYTVATHKYSLCGFWGGSDFQRIEIKAGEDLTCAISGQ